MTTMRDVINLHEKIRNTNPMQLMMGMGGEDLVDANNEIGQYMNTVSEKAEKLILEKIKEEDFVKALSGLSATLCSGFLVQGGSVAPIKFLMSGDMESFTHTLILAVIGMLIEEEVL